MLDQERRYVMWVLEDGEPRSISLPPLEAERIGLQSYGIDPWTFLYPDDDEDEDDD